MNSVPDLSLCLIVKNEALRLPACLASAAGLGAQLVVVDTGSTDGTVELARAAGARVGEIAWPDDFGAARNASLELATGRWILVLDADERLSAPAVEAIRRIVAGPADHACSLVQRNALAGGAGHVAVRIVRLFPNRPDVRFERPIHEQVNTSLERAGLRIVESDIGFEHEGYADARAMPAKLARNRALIEAALAREPDGDPNLRYFFASGFFDEGDHARAAEAYAACARAARSRRRRLAEAASIKRAECLTLLGRPAEAAALLAAEPGATAHPLACELRAAEAAGSGRGEEAARWRERLLAFADAAYLPPVALLPLKVKALEWLAGHLFGSGRKNAALLVLRLGVELAAGRLDPGAKVALAYRGAFGAGGTG
jgi:hypothetical protein